ncbi:MAG: translation elongation factor Ts [Patescibacteria group bacterium]|jgi:elongation factor Ts
MEISLDLIKKLRIQTGAGMMDCKKFLTQSKGDYDKAIELFRKEGQKIASKKSTRETQSGLVDSYIHPGNRVGVLINVACETDFVAQNSEFKQLVHDLAMHVAAFDPQYKEPQDIPADILDKEKDIYREQLKKEKKPAKMIEKILEGKLKKYYTEICLMEQPYLKDDKKTVRQYLTENIAKIGENIQIRSFIRYSL